MPEDRASPQALSITTLIVKLTSTCNLACPYCFMFEHADQSYRDRSNLMGEDVRVALATRVDEYLGATHDRLLLVFHGGEPLLFGKKRFRQLLERLCSGPNRKRLDLALQTNAALVDNDYIELFKEFDVTVGVSLDGPPEINDRHRPAKNGQGSYTMTVNGLRKLQSGLSDELFRGLLAVIQLEADPVGLFHHFLGLGVKRMDFLLPLRNHRYPWGYRELVSAGQTPYADWLLRILDEWRLRDDPQIRIRLFDSILELLLGSNANRADIHHSALDVITVETDGGIEPVDDLRVAGPEVNRTTYHVSTNALTDILGSPDFEPLREAETSLPAECTRCPHVRVCGGGGLAYRRTSHGYNAPSIYCEELKKLIAEIELRFGLNAA